LSQSPTLFALANVSMLSALSYIVVDKQYCFNGKFSGKNRVGAIFIIVTSYRIYYKQQIKRDASRLSMKTGAFLFFLLTRRETQHLPRRHLQGLRQILDRNAICPTKTLTAHKSSQRIIILSVVAKHESRAQDKNDKTELVTKLTVTRFSGRRKARFYHPHV
jgi:hypothetical protein